MLGNDGLANNKYEVIHKDDVIGIDTSNVNDGSDSTNKLILMRDDPFRDEAPPTARGEYLPILLTKITCLIIKV